MPTDKPITLQEHAMRFGTFMGIFWIFKFIFLSLGIHYPSPSAIVRTAYPVRSCVRIHLRTQVQKYIL